MEQLGFCPAGGGSESECDGRQYRADTLERIRILPSGSASQPDNEAQYSLSQSLQTASMNKNEDVDKVSATPEASFKTNKGSCARPSRQLSLFSPESFHEAHRQLGLAAPSLPSTPSVSGLSQTDLGLYSSSVLQSAQRSSSEDGLISAACSSASLPVNPGAQRLSPQPVSRSSTSAVANTGRTNSSTEATGRIVNTVAAPSRQRQRDCSSPFFYHTLRFLLVGDSDVGKNEILEKFDAHRLPLVNQKEVEFKTTMILLDGKRIKLQLWDTSGQGRFSTIIQSYSRGADGILLVFDITNKWSFESIDKWLKEVDEYASGVPRVLVGNRLHFEFRREVSKLTALQYASKHSMSYLEVSPLADYNITETFVDLSRQVLNRIRLHSWHENRVLSLQELCCRTIVQRTTSYSIERLPLPASVKFNLKSYSLHPAAACSFSMLPLSCCSSCGTLRAHHHHHHAHHPQSHGGSNSSHSHQLNRHCGGSVCSGSGTVIGKNRRTSSPHNLLENIPGSLRGQDKKCTIS